MVRHRIRRAYLGAGELSMLQALDYNLRSVGSLEYSSVRVLREPDSHHSALAKDVAVKGVKRPIIVFMRNNTGPGLLVEGHHRAVLSLRYKFTAPADLHECFCDDESLSDFGLCDEVLKACALDRANAGVDHWDWTLA